MGIRWLGAIKAIQSSYPCESSGSIPALVIHFHGVSIVDTLLKTSSSWCNPQSTLSNERKNAVEGLMNSYSFSCEAGGIVHTGDLSRAYRGDALTLNNQSSCSWRYKIGIQYPGWSSKWCRETPLSILVHHCYGLWLHPLTIMINDWEYGFTLRLARTRRFGSQKLVDVEFANDVALSLITDTMELEEQKS